MHAAALGSKLLKNAPVQVLCNWKLAFCQRQTINQFCITRSARLRCHRRGNWTTFPSAKAKVGGNLQFPTLRQVIATKCVVTSVFTLQLCMLQFIVANKCTSNSDLIQEHNHDCRKFENPWNDIFWVINQKKITHIFDEHVPVGIARVFKPRVPVLTDFVLFVSDNWRFKLKVGHLV
jgi:hypothetical protein